MNLIENAPDLELDKVLYKDRTMPPHVRRERRIVWNLFNHLLQNGLWKVTKVYDGDEYVRVNNSKDALEVIFNLDDAHVFVNSISHPGITHSITLVLGNDINIISDWIYAEGDPDGFSAAMEKFDAEVYA
jgi:hypothetical protein